MTLFYSFSFISVSHYTLHSNPYQQHFYCHTLVHNFLFHSSTDEDDDNTVQALGRLVMRQNDVVDPEVSIIAKIQEHRYDDNDNKVRDNSALIGSKWSFDSDGIHDNGVQGQGGVNDYDLVHSNEDRNKSGIEGNDCNDIK